MQLRTVWSLAGEYPNHVRLTKNTTLKATSTEIDPGPAVPLPELPQTEERPMIREWITRLAGDERRRDAVRTSEMEAAARRRISRTGMDGGWSTSLRSTITHDLDAFRLEFPFDSARELILDAGAEGGFEVRKPGRPAVSLSVVPRWDTASVSCDYCFTSEGGLPARRERFDLVFAPIGADAARFKHDGSGQVFSTADALSVSADTRFHGPSAVTGDGHLYQRSAPSRT